MSFRVRETAPCAAAKETYTYGDYEKWPDDQRWELIDGVPYDMTPAPSRKHQEILGELHRQFANYLLNKPCQVYLAPFDVRLPKGAEAEEKVDTVVQPDLTVVCDPAKLDEKGCSGAPDLVVEILSPHTAAKDMKIKLALYERAGVKEYWLVQPVDKTVMVFSLNENGEYAKPAIYDGQDSVGIGIFRGELIVDLAGVFRE